MLFCEANGNCWKRMASYVGVDETQLHRAMMCKIQFNRLVKRKVHHRKKDVGKREKEATQIYDARSVRWKKVVNGEKSTA